uniref:hypothetical protein n=1 Tax=Herbidospora sakaeratensis TaxID=564415 RepID=UPI00078435CE|nr:hypothetical protein [Herbidospora sakaeratensis]
MNLFRRRPKLPVFEFSHTVPNGYGQVVILNDAPDTLARYNAERGRGIVHTPEWDAAMADLQREHDHATYCADRWMHTADEATDYAIQAADAEQRITNALRVAESWRDASRAATDATPEEQLSSALIAMVCNEVTAALNGQKATLADATTIPATREPQR